MAYMANCQEGKHLHDDLCIQRGWILSMQREEILKSVLAASKADGAKGHKSILSRICNMQDTKQATPISLGRHRNSCMILEMQYKQAHTFPDQAPDQTSTIMVMSTRRHCLP